MSIINPIKLQRIEHNMTQQKLADQLGVTCFAVSRWETGVAFPRIKHLQKLADIFSCKVDDLIPGKES